MLLNKKQATDLAKAWRLGNKFRKKSLTKKHTLAPATSKNTGRVKMGIRMDIESKPREYYPALDDDGALVFFTGNPMKRIPLSDLFTPPKAGKNRTRVPAKENKMINHHLTILKSIFPNQEESILESFLEKYPFDLKGYSIYEMKLQMKSYLIQLDERTEYQLVAQKTDGTELKSKFYKTENELAELQQRCEDSDDYESTSVMKRIVDVDENENEDDEDSMGGVYNNEVDYTDGADIEDEQDFSEDKSKYKELYTLTNLALRQIPGSPKQRETIKKLNDVRKSLGMKPLKEMDIDINDEVNESVKEDAVSRAKEKADLKKKHDAEKEQEKEEIKSINSEEAEIEESKVFDKLRFKGTDKKLAMSVVDMIKKKAKPKEIAKSFKKLKLPSQELIMKTLGDKSAQDLLQKGQLINQLVGIFDEAEPKGLDGRSKEFRNKVRKLEYNKNKNKSKAYEVWGESTELKEKKLKALQTKSDKTGIPYGILKQVFNRGVAAWRTGHRPGTNPTQWGYARVNSFATKSKGTWGGADKDLADKARGSMKKK
jgi:hypothetical protein